MYCRIAVAEFDCSTDSSQARLYQRPGPMSRIPQQSHLRNTPHEELVQHQEAPVLCKAVEDRREEERDLIQQILAEERELFHQLIQPYERALTSHSSRS